MTSPQLGLHPASGDDRRSLLGALELVAGGDVQFVQIAGAEVGQGVAFEPGSIKKEEVVAFLKALKAHLKQPLLVIWDGLRAHRSRLVRDYLDTLGGHIQIAFLPPYSPDLNPVEYLWAWLKRHALANYCPNDLSELHTTARNKLKSAQKATLDHRRLLDAGYAVLMS
jgi:transposase